MSNLPQAYLAGIALTVSYVAKNPAEAEVFRRFTCVTSRLLPREYTSKSPEVTSQNFPRGIRVEFVVSKIST